MALKAFVFDVGETLVDETRLWERAADAAGVPRFTLMGVLGGLAARGEHHDRAWELLGVERPGLDLGAERLLSRRAAVPGGAALAGLPRRRSREHAHRDGGAAARARRPVGSSARWGVEKPAPEFFERIVEESGVAADEIAYVGDRVDNDVRPAIDAGMVAVHIRRGPWGHLFDAPPRAIRIRSLAELPEAVGV